VVELIASGIDAVGLSAKLANSIGRSNALHKTYGAGRNQGGAHGRRSQATGPAEDA
jgi:hypothetical protein